jgi:hypothetical protein
MPELVLTLGHFAPVTLIPVDFFVLGYISDNFVFSLYLKL